MKILALEFSSLLRAVAVSGGTRPGYAEESGRSSKPFALIDAALRQAELAREQIEGIAIGLGPGSNAGVRTAIAIAKGWQLVRGTKLLGISSADVVAVQGREIYSGAPILVGLEVRKGELWVAQYDATTFEPRLIEPFHPVAGECAAGPVLRMDAIHAAGLPDRSVPMVPRADVLARLAATRRHFVTGRELEPVNLRPVEFVKAPAPRLTAE